MSSSLLKTFCRLKITIKKNKKKINHQSFRYCWTKKNMQLIKLMTLKGLESGREMGNFMERELEE